FRWMSEYQEWMQFVFSLFEKRLLEVMELVEAITFQKADIRLWHHLQKKVKIAENPILAITHQELASEIGTVREVVSRLLKQLEREGKLSLSRGKIQVLKA
ncbi:MAG TPA: Crp/Fnr family transcriptional regulator, partial [Bacteroidetes bacterium]|nr:Crp/Fnr family transcriptional regulator [Bacteroidota bacterium]